MYDDFDVLLSGKHVNFVDVFVFVILSLAMIFQKLICFNDDFSNSGFREITSSKLDAKKSILVKLTDLDTKIKESVSELVSSSFA